MTAIYVDSSKRSARGCILPLNFNLRYIYLFWLMAKKISSTHDVMDKTVLIDEFYRYKNSYNFLYVRYNTWLYIEMLMLVS